MGCAEAPVAQTWGRFCADRFGIPFVYNQPGPGGVYLGIVGDQAHASHASSHNCAPMQESGAYDPNHAHAYDARPATAAIGMAMLEAVKADPHRRGRYVIYDNVIYEADEGWQPRPRPGHPTWHVSFLPGTTFDTRPFTAELPPAPHRPPEDDEMIVKLTGNPTGKPPLYVGGLPHAVPGPFVKLYADAREGRGVVELPDNRNGNAHYDKVAALVKANN